MRVKKGAEHRPSFLLLDDDETWLRSLSRFLRVRAKADCVTHTTPEPVFAALDRGPRPQLCIIDYALGAGWTGARVARALRERLGRRTPTLVLLSGSLEDVSDRERGYFDAVYSKSINPDVLLEELRRLTEPAARQPRSYLRLTPAGRAEAREAARKRRKSE